MVFTHREMGKGHGVWALDGGYNDWLDGIPRVILRVAWLSSQGGSGVKGLGSYCFLVFSSLFFLFCSRDLVATQLYDYRTARHTVCKLEFSTCDWKCQ